MPLGTKTTTVRRMAQTMMRIREEAIYCVASQKKFWLIVYFKCLHSLEDILCFFVQIFCWLAEVSLHISSLSVCEGYGLRMDGKDRIIVSLKTLLGEMKKLMVKELGPRWETKSQTDPIATVLARGKLCDSYNSKRFPGDNWFFLIPFHNHN